MSGFFSRFADRGLPAQLALYGIGLAILGAALTGALRGSVAAFSSVEPNVFVAFSSPVSTALATPPTVERRVLSDEAWASQLRQPSYWAGRRSGSGGSSTWSLPKSGLGMPPSGYILLPPAQQAPRPGFDEGRSSGRTFATVCVRMCDGFYFPVSHSTTRDRFSEDDRKCKSSCGSDARLFVYRNEGGSPEDMEDLKGDPYIGLKTAFLYRTTYDAACKCRPHPWEQQAVDQHRVYALEAQVRKGDKRAVAELKALRADIAAGRAGQSRGAGIPGQRAAAVSPTRVAAAPAPTLTDDSRHPPTGILGVAATAGPSGPPAAAPNQPVNLSPLRPVAPGTSALPPRIEPAVAARLAADGPPPGEAAATASVTTAALPAASLPPRTSPAGDITAATPETHPKVTRGAQKAARNVDMARATPAPAPGVQPVVLINPGPTKAANAKRVEGSRRKAWSDR